MIDPITGAAVITGLGHLIGGERANATNAQQAQKNRDFQEHMSNTSFQRGVEDLKKAGLNPALAYGRGGASTPGGATAAPAHNTLGEATGGAVAAAQSRASIEETKARTAHEQAKARVANLDAAFLETFQGQEFAARLNEIARRGALAGREADPSNIQRLNQQADADLRLTNTSARGASANATLHELQIPAARAQERIDKTKYGQYVRPFIADAKSAASIGGSLLMGGAATRVTRNLDRIRNARNTKLPPPTKGGPYDPNRKGKIPPS